MIDAMNVVGDKIRIQRLTKNYSQEYMAFMLDISQAAYSKLERNETDISLNRLIEIAEILEISPFILMPKPKYGFGINQELVYNTLYKIKKFFVGKIRKRKEAAKTHPFVNGQNSDIPKLKGL